MWSWRSSPGSGRGIYSCVVAEGKTAGARVAGQGNGVFFLRGFASQRSFTGGVLNDFLAACNRVHARHDSRSAKRAVVKVFAAATGRDVGDFGITTTKVPSVQGVSPSRWKEEAAYMRSCTDTAPRADTGCTDRNASASGVYLGADDHRPASAGTFLRSRMESRCGWRTGPLPGSAGSAHSAPGEVPAALPSANILPVFLGLFIDASAPDKAQRLSVELVAVHFYCLPCAMPSSEWLRWASFRPSHMSRRRLCAALPNGRTRR